MERSEVGAGDELEIHTRRVEEVDAAAPVLGVRRLRASALWVRPEVEPAPFQQVKGSIEVVVRAEEGHVHRQDVVPRRGSGELEHDPVGEHDVGERPPRLGVFSLEDIDVELRRGGWIGCGDDGVVEGC